MNANKENFLKWFKQPLEQLYTNPDAGFAIMIISLPLLERYMREKSKVFEARSLSAPFYEECLKVFSGFGSEPTTRRFWEACRHGLLHQVTFRKRAKADPCILITGGIKEMEYVERDDTFYLNPTWFSKVIIELIESDFATFEGANSADHELPQISTFEGLQLTNSPEKVIEESGWLVSGVVQNAPSKPGSG